MSPPRGGLTAALVVPVLLREVTFRRSGTFCARSTPSAWFVPSRRLGSARS
ncbi:hypothetical protein ACFCZ1_01580 [Streptomyces sp. NPDC056224]|uniref:hypothetical protein n=1 Tax=Streptomyces sp. NPDC056224 TaxID=3345750 RepID=UPI0035D74A73